MKRLGWVVVGIVIGVGITIAAQTGRAQQAGSGSATFTPRLQSATGIRLSTQEAGAVDYLHAEFVLDNKTGNCWFVLSSRDDSKPAAAIAAAPARACED